MFVTEVGSVLTTVLWVQALAGHGEAPQDLSGRRNCGCGFACCLPIFPKRWQEGRGKAQAAALRRTRKEDTTPKSSPNRTATLRSQQCHPLT